MQFLAWTVTIALVISCHAAAEVQTDVIQEGDCPLLCVCTGSIINCSRVTLFPENLPKETAEFHITNSTVSFIPMNVFLNLPRLERISMSHMTIDTLRACSFAELENMTEIVFRDVKIYVMEGNSFSNLMNITKLSFEDSLISEIRSYSIHGAGKIGSLSFIRTNITSFHPYSVLKIDSVNEISFENCNIKTFRYRGMFNIENCTHFMIKDSVIEHWQCGSLDTFASNSTSISVTQSIFRCNCNLAWLWKDYPDKPVIAEESNRCMVSGNRLSTQTIDVVCPAVDSRDEGCRPLLPTPPHSCSRDFDNPVIPVDEVDYPTFFTPPDNSCEELLCQEKFIIPLITLSSLWTVCH